MRQMLSEEKKKKKMMPQTVREYLCCGRFTVNTQT